MSTQRAVRIRENFLPFAAPLVGQEELDGVMACVRSGWLTTGLKVQEFERAFSDYIGCRHALAVNSCTAALHLALEAIGVGEGDEVITSPMTFTATAAVIEHLKARPVFSDCEPDSLNLDARAIERRITPRTKAILPVHFAGQACDMNAILELAKRRGLKVIEDAAHALPARYKGRWIGSGENPVAFSFYATKNLTTGEGGMLTGSPEFLERARIVSLHGMSRDAWKRYDKSGQWYYEVLLPGFKYNMTDIQAAIGIWQLRKLASFEQRRRAVAAAYDRGFADDDALEAPTERPDVEHAWHLYVLRLRLEALRIDRDQFIDELTRRNIGTSVHFIPIHLHPYYREKYRFGPETYPIAYSNYRRMISLPLNARLTDADVGNVIDAVRDVARTYRR